MYRYQSTLALFTAFVSILSAQPGNPRTEEWKSRNNLGNRYEGTVSLPINNSFSLLSLTAAFERPAAKKANLKVRFFLPSGHTPIIRAREPASYYWMESKPNAVSWQPEGWNDFTPWLTSDVIERRGIDLGKVGVVVYLDQPDCSSCLIAPSWVYASNTPPHSGTYTFLVRPNAPMDSIDYGLYQVVNEKEVEVVSSKLGFQSGGVPFKIPVDFDRLAQGKLRLVVLGHVQSDSKARPILQLSFFHRLP